jgi:Zn-dependent M16 (insulinase) family peptidase
MKKKVNKIANPLTEEEIKQIRQHLITAEEQEKKTVSSSKTSFINWLKLIDIASSIIEKIANLDWKQIQLGIINAISHLLNN